MSKWDKLIARICALSKDMRFDELRKVLEMGVDLLQGYCLARPATEPVAIDEKAAEVIAEVERQKAEQEEAWS